MADTDNLYREATDLCKNKKEILIEQETELETAKEKLIEFSDKDHKEFNLMDEIEKAVDITDLGLDISDPLPLDRMLSLVQHQFDNNVTLDVGLDLNDYSPTPNSPGGPK